MESCPTYEYSLPITPTIQEVIDLVQHFVPHEPSANCSFKQFTDGLTNRLFKIAYDDGTERNQILIRIYGEKTELLIDREKELKSMIELEKYGFAPKVYGKFVNGVCYGYFSGKPFTNLDIIDTAKSALVAAHLARFHTVTIPGIPTNPSLFDTLHKWQNEVKNLNSEQFSQEEFENNGFYNENGFSNELTFLKDKMKEFNKDWEVVFCHNDLLSGNIIFKEDSVQFIDYEYGSYNYLLFDVANHLCESMGVDVDLSVINFYLILFNFNFLSKFFYWIAAIPIGRFY